PESTEWWMRSASAAEAGDSGRQSHGEPPGSSSMAYCRRSPAATQPQESVDSKFGAVQRRIPAYDGCVAISGSVAREIGAARVARRPPRAFDLLLTLTASDIRSRYGRGPARSIKWLLDPFAAVGVYLLLIATVVPRAGRAPGLSLACAVVPFQLLMM